MRTRALRRGNAQAGFTLVELLVAMTLLGFILAALLGGMSFGARVWERSEAQASRTQDLQLVHRVLSDLVGRAFPAVRERDGELLYEFEGRADELRFVAFLPGFVDAGGLNQLVLRIVERDDKHQLRLLRHVHQPLGGEPDAEREDTLLLETEAALGFAYFGAAEGDDEAEWHDDWTGGDSPPRLVRLASDRPGLWPELTIELAIDMDLTCASPASVGRCRLLEARRP